MNESVIERRGKNGVVQYYRVDKKAITEAEYNRIVKKEPASVFSRGTGGSRSFYKDRLERISKEEHAQFVTPKGPAKPPQRRSSAETSYATVFVLELQERDFADAEAYEEFMEALEAGEKTLDELASLFLRIRPEARKKIKNGDVFEVGPLAGYRTEGRYMWSKKAASLKAVDLDFDKTEYGAPPKLFSFPEFTPHYWDDGKMKSYPPGADYASYWADDTASRLPVNVDPRAAGVWYGVSGVPYYGVYGDKLVLMKPIGKKPATTKMSRLSKKTQKDLAVVGLPRWLFDDDYQKRHPLAARVADEHKSKQIFASIDALK